MRVSILTYGLDGIRKRAEREKFNIERGLDAGLRKAGLLLQRASQQLVPIDLGILRASAYTRRLGVGTGANTVIAVGYTASYAGMVHEEVDLAHGTEYNSKYAAEIASGAKYYRRAESPPNGKKSWPGGWVKYHARGQHQDAKFLSTAAIWNMQLMARVIQQEIQSHQGR